MSILLLKSVNGINSYLNSEWKKFKNKKTSMEYTGDKVVLLEFPNKLIYVTKESYIKYFGKNNDKLQEVEEITSWQRKKDNLKISAKFGIPKQKWMSRKKSGTRSSTTTKNRGSV